METGIGATLREARNRRKLDLSEVEAAIKIRPRYLSALENEEWDVLPGGAYTRGFIRTYAAYLGLDGERLADEYRQATAPAGGERVPRRIEPVPASARGAGGPRIPGALVATVVVLFLVGVVVAIGLAGGGGDGESKAPSAQGKQARKQGRGEQRRSVAAKPGIALGLAATGEVWVCVLNSSQEAVVDGEILEAGSEAGPFRDEGFKMAFGNGEVEVSIDGKRAKTEASNSPVGYEVGADGELRALEEGERPTCT
ncbi:MAG TPA: helix-turn-helix domain-containing protein [Solirubrobacterales bacterium]|jgi:transcriptional regulator with XRE-family HTH domain|nr:helix-turn-helix domain-containing protein [Solirubrobacterales bacterium]